MKKILSTILIVATLLSLTACGNTTGNTNDATNQPDNVENQEEVKLLPDISSISLEEMSDNSLLDILNNEELFKNAIRVDYATNREIKNDGLGRYNYEKNYVVKGFALSESDKFSPDYEITVGVYYDDIGAFRSLYALVTSIKAEDLEKSRDAVINVISKIAGDEIKESLSNLEDNTWHNNIYETESYYVDASNKCNILTDDELMTVDEAMEASSYDKNNRSNQLRYSIDIVDKNIQDNSKVYEDIDIDIKNIEGLTGSRVLSKEDGIVQSIDKFNDDNIKLTLNSYNDSIRGGSSELNHAASNSTLKYKDVDFIFDTSDYISVVNGSIFNTHAYEISTSSNSLEDASKYKELAILMLNKLYGIEDTLDNTDGNSSFEKEYTLDNQNKLTLSYSITPEEVEQVVEKTEVIEEITDEVNEVTEDTVFELEEKEPETETIVVTVYNLRISFNETTVTNKED